MFVDFFIFIHFHYMKMHRLSKKANLVIANRNNNVSFEFSTYIITAGITIRPSLWYYWDIMQLKILHKKNSVEQWLVFLAERVNHHVFDLPLGQAKGHNKGIYCLSNRLTEELAQQWEYYIWVDYCFNELALCG